MQRRRLKQTQSLEERLAEEADRQGEIFEGSGRTVILDGTAVHDRRSIRRHCKFEGPRLH